MGMNEDVRAPVINSSNTRSGIRKDAKKMSNCSVEKYPARIRYLRKPNNRDMTIMQARSKAEENILLCLEKTNCVVL